MKFFINLINSVKYFYKKTFLKNKILNEENVEILSLITDDITKGNFENFEAYEKIKEYELFDEDYYLNQCTFKPTVDSLIHYLYKGHKMNYNPCEIFNTSFYRSRANIKENENPLAYFVNYGMYEGITQVNKDLWQPPSINKFRLDEEITAFKNFGINQEERKSKLIVSLTSYPKRIHEIKYTLYSLLNQEVKPDKIVLWLSKNEFPNREEDLPKELLNFLKHGLTIKWCDTLKSYKKLLPSLNAYPNDIIVTADDDLYYPKEWLKLLYEYHIKYPNEILTHRSRRISFNNNNICKYLDWELSENEEEASFLNFFTTGGGVLFPPNSFSKIVEDRQIYEKICPNGDDIWFWGMAILNDTKIRVVKHNLFIVTYVNPARDIVFNKDTLWSYNEKHNDEQFNALFNKYPEIYDKILKEYETKENLN